MEYLAARTGIETRLFLPADYQDTLRLFSEKKVDLAYLGGLTFVQAESKSGARPLVMRAVDTRFTTWFLARPEQKEVELSDFKGKKFSFGSKLSTSGHLMPRHFLRTQWDIDPGAYFSRVEYSGAHDQTAYAVRDGEIDIGAANSKIIRNMLDDGRLAPNQLAVVWQTPPYADYIWAVQPEMDKTLVTKLRDAFLGLDSRDEKQARILRGVDAENYLPARLADFSDLRKIADELGFLSMEGP
jgi:phosphonate transport system substrate-binding protein